MTHAARNMSKLLGNLLLTLLSLALVLLAFEFIVFRHVLPAADVPETVMQHEVIRLKPGQEGVFRVRSDLAARFCINEQGWNSGRAHYETPRTPGVKRIAIIGDSYVEGLRVDCTDSLAEQLEKNLGNDIEVYRFGISGAPLSQYLHMLRKEVMAYAPDLVVVVVVHNDFDESYAFKAGTRTSAFLKLQVEDGAVTGEIPPRPLPRHWYDPLRKSATWRYLGVRLGLRFQALRDMVFGREKPHAYEANIDAEGLDAPGENPRLAKDRAVAEYVLDRMKRVTEAGGSRLLVAMDGVRSLIENGSPVVMDYTRGALRLNKMMRTLTGEKGILFLDLHPVFLADYAQKGQAFAFAHDGHWNTRANALAADALAEAITVHHLLP